MSVEMMNHDQFTRFEKASYDPPTNLEVTDGRDVGNPEGNKQNPDDKKSEFRREEIKRQNEEINKERNEVASKMDNNNQQWWPPPESPEIINPNPNPKLLANGSTEGGAPQRST